MAIRHYILSCDIPSLATLYHHIVALQLRDYRHDILFASESPIALSRLHTYDPSHKAWHQHAAT